MSRAWLSQTWLEQLSVRLQNMKPPQHGPRVRRSSLLYQCLREDILSDVIPADTCLPSSRQLWQTLGWGRNSILVALAQLIADDLVRPEARRGLFVRPRLRTAPGVRTQTSQVPPPTQADLIAQRAAAAVQSAATTELPGRGAFVAGIPDVSAFPYAQWQSYCQRYGRHPNMAWVGYNYQGGLLELRRTIAQHLLLARGIDCTPEQVLITANTQQSMLLLAHLLADPGALAWLENPGYLGAQAAFQAAGLSVYGCALDGEGLVVPSLLKPAPKLIYVTPSHQYPTGTVMSLARRLALLKLAQAQQAWILEDDYDSEFRYAGAPLLSLFALAQQTMPSFALRNVYLGTFSKSLFPALQLAYMVLPESIVDSARVWLDRHLREPAYLQQAALAAWIADGHFSRYSRRQRKVYAQRSAILATAWRSAFGETLPLTGEQAGLHLCTHFPPTVNDVLVAQTLAQQGLLVRPLSAYQTAPRHQLAPILRGLVLGFGDVDERRLRSACQRLVDGVAQAISLTTAGSG